jgi:hypothetical protein
MIFSGPLIQAKIEVSSLAPEHIIKPGELWFPVGRLCSDQADELHF